ncbi:MAG: DUF4114 domain-containing protein [Sandaracinaceae bacterium]|nr:DUF4114 domain-containing protein [Sandaracinaceae bacterium]
MPRIVALLAVLAIAAPASADVVTQPTGERVPSDPGCNGGRPTGLLATFACICEEAGICNIGDPCPSESSCPDGRNGNCESRMFHVFNDNTCIPSQSDGIDPREDASLLPETFSPTCALTFTVESRGTALFESAFGWYNASTDGTPPSPDDLHVMLACDAAPGSSVVLDVRSEPDYRGGEIGFFLLTPEERPSSARCAGGDCCATVDRLRGGEGYAYYSQRELNPDARGADSFVHLLVYDSRIFERTFYFAWEDTFNTANNDFTDLVTSVTGVECAGAGADCDTGMVGACGRGITRCTGGTLECTPRFSGEPERCDGLDNDCNGVVDDAVTCPGEAVCDDGACVPHCQLAVEFQCGGVRIECDTDTGLCVEPSCLGVTCPSGQVCRDGECRGECDGIVCPGDATCILDSCVDQCAEVSCPSGSVCRGGFCLPGCNQCDGLICAPAEVCDATSGDCRHPDCPSSCPAGQVCDGPAGCHDACDGAVCPRGQVCRMGRCGMLLPGEDGGLVSAMDGGALDGGVGADAGLRRSQPGCDCRAAPRGHDGAPLGVLAALALGLFVRRRG